MIDVQLANTVERIQRVDIVGPACAQHVGDVGGFFGEQLPGALVSRRRHTIPNRCTETCRRTPVAAVVGDRNLGVGSGETAPRRRSN